MKFLKKLAKGLETAKTAVSVIRLFTTGKIDDNLRKSGVYIDLGQRVTEQIEQAKEDVKTK